MYGIRVELWKFENGKETKISEASRMIEGITLDDYKRVLEALGPPVPIVDKEYVYIGDIKLYHGKPCVIVDLLEFEKSQLFTSNVRIKFKSDNSEWVVPANRLRLP
jgi:hypothetical protein